LVNITAKYAFYNKLGTKSVLNNKEEEIAAGSRVLQIVLLSLSAYPPWYYIHKKNNKRLYTKMLPRISNYNKI
jgi:hypothetical protein